MTKIKIRNLESTRNMKKRFPKFNFFSIKIENIIPFSMRYCCKNFQYISIFRFRKLEDLNLTMNNIKELDHRLFSLRHLRILDVSDNELAVLPAEIGNLTQLIELNLNRNSIAKLPDTMQNCKLLTTLNLSSNPFTR